MTKSLGQIEKVVALSKYGYYLLPKAISKHKLSLSRELFTFFQSLIAAAYLRKKIKNPSIVVVL